MSQPNRHTIGKQVIRLTVPPSENISELQQRVSHVQWKKIGPALETLFDRYADAGEQIILDHLNVDIGIIGQQNLEEELPKKLIACVEEALQKRIGGNHSSDVTQQPLRAGHFQQWLYFLEHGYLPWNGRGAENEASLLNSVLETLAAEAPAQERLHSLLARRGLAFGRLLRQHQEVFLKSLTAIFTAQNQDGLMAFRSELTALSQRGLTDVTMPKLFREALAREAGGLPYFFWKTVLEPVIFKGEKHSWQALATIVLAEFVPDRETPVFFGPLRTWAQKQKDSGKALPILSKILTDYSADGAVLQEVFVPKTAAEKGAEQSSAHPSGLSPDVPEGKFPSEKAEVPDSVGATSNAIPTGKKEAVDTVWNDTDRAALQEVFVPKTTPEKEADQSSAHPSGLSPDVPDEKFPSKNAELPDSVGATSKPVPTDKKEAVDAGWNDAGGAVLQEVFVSKTVVENGTDQSPANPFGLSPDVPDGQFSTEKAELPDSVGATSNDVPTGKKEAVDAGWNDAGGAVLPEVFVPKTAATKEADQSPAHPSSLSPEVPDRRFPSEKSELPDSVGATSNAIPTSKKEAVDTGWNDAGGAALQEVFVPKTAAEKEANQSPAHPSGLSPDVPDRKFPSEKAEVPDSVETTSNPVPTGKKEAVDAGWNDAGGAALQEVFVPKMAAEKGADQSPAHSFSLSPDVPDGQFSAEKAELPDSVGATSNAIPTGKKEAVDTGWNDADGAVLPEVFVPKNDKLNSERVSAGDGQNFHSDLPAIALQNDIENPSDNNKSEDARDLLMGQAEKVGLLPPLELAQKDVLADSTKEPLLTNQAMVEEKKQPSGQGFGQDKGAAVQFAEATKEVPSQFPAVAQQQTELSPFPSAKPGAKGRTGAIDYGPAHGGPPTSYLPVGKLAPKRAFSAIEKGEALFVQYAGMVLVHPFLPSFFTGLGLVEGIDFKDETQRHRAVHLLHYLVTKETGLPEFALLLPKLLCGLPFEEPMERYVELTQKEMDESENLLSAVIQHWGALGGSSPDALREGFLCRDGKLELKESGWHLTIEHKTMDILLNRLPWGIGIVKLPWMEGMLRVEWG